MKQLPKVLSSLALAGALAACGGEKAPTGPETQNTLSALTTGIPAGATVDSARLQVYPNSTAPTAFSLHQVTAAWDESSVTWNSFAAAFDPAATATGAVVDTGWLSIDVTAAALSWIDGSLPNNGLLLAAGPDTGIVEVCFASREQGALGPQLVIYLTLLDSSQLTQTLAAGADATLEQGMPDANFGTTATICAGSDAPEGPFTQALVRFDIQVEEDLGCTRSKGYWKNHAGLGPQADVVTELLPISLGSLQVNTPDTAVLILQQHHFGDPSNGITKLYAQLLAAKLNIAAGASSEAVDDVIADADLFLADHDWTAWDTLSSDGQKDALMWMGTLGAYNEGWIGPGSCDDGDDVDCDDGEHDGGDADHDGDDGDHDGDQGGDHDGDDGDHEGDDGGGGD